MSTQSRTIIDILAAAGAGCFATAVGHPADTLKVLLQTSPHNHSSSSRAVADLLHLHGPKILIRGMFPPLVNAVLMNTVMFGVFNAAEQRLLLHMSAGSGDCNHYRLGLTEHMTAGFLSGVAQACLSTPVDLIKVQLQVGAAPTAQQLIRQILLTQPQVLTTGHVMNMCREGVFTALYLGLYATWRPDSDSNLAPPLWAVAMASGTTGALAWIASSPFDCVKSVQQAALLASSQPHLTARAVAMQLWDAGGVRAFFRGLKVSTVRACVLCC